MKGLVITDLHADWITDGFQRYEDVRAAVETAIRETLGWADTLLVLGDVSDPDTKGVHRASAFAVEIASTFEGRQIWLTGNHDVVEDEIGSHTLMGVKALENALHPRLVVADRPRTLILGRTLVVCLPYTSLTNTYDPEAFVQEIDTQVPYEHVLVLGHLNLEGITPGSETTDMPRGRDVFYPVEAIKKRFYGTPITMLNGHYHERQVHRGVVNVGSLVRLTHGEERNRTGYGTIELP